ncbi:MAG: AmmeMemoRadiSam system radical SAM enzyme [Candidatus Altiarchaeales archaeon]|nr:MAG: AmmeMemoRadiSam system radical SAM enzyme [Candidatus Altiarchaeales archaeon]
MKEEKREKKIASPLKYKLTRRDFLKKGIVGLAGLSLGYYLLEEFFLKNLPENNLVFRKSAPEKLWKWSKEAYFYERFPSYVKCRLCPHGCILNEGDRGRCRDRVNFKGKLYTLTYGNPCAVHIDPIEKKPLFHFLPGSFAFSIATAGCNLRCKYCQNWEISQFPPEETKNYDLMPENLVRAVTREREKNEKVRSIAYTYSEPTVFYEYMSDTTRISKREGIRNVVITAGYINEKPLKELAKNVDAIKIDLKGFNERFYREVVEGELERVLKSCKISYKKAKCFEIVNLVVPTLNDSLDEIRELSRWIKENLSRDVPLHFSRFYPRYKLKNLPPTPLETLKKAREIALEEGLNFVYIGNVPHGEHENTYCPKCGKLLIERIGYFVKENNIIEGRCKFCGERIPGIWE